MTTRLNLVFILFLFSQSLLIGQESNENKEGKTGWNFGALPTITYNSDLGLQYGALVNLYDYGDGEVYPTYYHSIYAEVSRYTKGSGIFRLFYDSKFLIPNIRFTGDLSYLPDQALDFYGFNGSKAVYNKDWEDDSSDSYKTRMFYKQKRNIFRTKLDFQGKTGIKNLNWAAGLNLMNFDLNTVDIEKLNKGKDDDKILPDTATLYDQYVKWGVISEKETKGGFFTSLKGGLVYDSRDNEPNPMKGLWSEAVLFQSFNSDFTFTKVAITHRQYFTLIKENLSFAYRLGFQGVIAGEAPYYLLPYMVYSYLPSSTTDGLGGSKSVRGIVRNRVVGKSMGYANMELRWKFSHFTLLNQNIYLALNPFMDFGQVLVEHDFERDITKLESSDNLDDYFKSGSDKLHITYGCGFHLAMNQNFIIAIDAGFPLEEQDGNMGLYIGLNFLF
ncbi:MAG: hypothetical protein JEZ09_00530 [Salinivirgaceae bacterium]|nr:hypothetical protein [Salinivirgaceae bacterium]